MRELLPTFVGPEDVAPLFCEPKPSQHRVSEVEHSGCAKSKVEESSQLLEAQQWLSYVLFRKIFQKPPPLAPKEGFEKFMSAKILRYRVFGHEVFAGCSLRTFGVSCSAVEATKME